MSLSISSLPQELLVHIFLNLPPAQRQVVSCACKLFQKIISDSIFEKDREALHLQRAFPQKLIEAVGGLSALQALEARDINPNIPPLQPIRGKEHNALYFRLECFSPQRTFYTSVYILKQVPDQNWCITTSQVFPNTRPLEDIDFQHISRLFENELAPLRCFHTKLTLSDRRYSQKLVNIQNLLKQD